MLLKDILYKVAIRSVSGSTQVEVTDLQIDSRQVGKGSCFIAIRVSNQTGMSISAWRKKTAQPRSYEQIPAEMSNGVTYVTVAESSEAAGLMAHLFYGE